MQDKATIIYSGFWDVPLAFVTKYQDKQFLFFREFDNQLDEYSENYQVFLLPNLTDAEINKNWIHIKQLTSQYLGEVPVRQIIFDASHRKTIDTDVLKNLAEKLN